MKHPTKYGEIIAAARQAIDSNLPERDIVKLLRKAAGVCCRTPYKEPGEKLTADLKAYHRKRRERLKAEGRCTDCGFRNDRLPLGTCSVCNDRRRPQIRR